MNSMKRLALMGAGKTGAEPDQGQPEDEASPGGDSDVDLAETRLFARSFTGKGQGEPLYRVSR